MTTREEMSDLLIEQAETMSNAEALKHARAARKLWRAMDKALEYLDGLRDPMNAALFALGAAVNRLLSLGVSLDQIVDLVHGNAAAFQAQKARAESAALEVATRGQPEN